MSASADGHRLEGCLHCRRTVAALGELPDAAALASQAGLTRLSPDPMRLPVSPYNFTLTKKLSRSASGHDWHHVARQHHVQCLRCCNSNALRLPPSHCAGRCYESNRRDIRQVFISDLHNRSGVVTYEHTTVFMADQAA